MAKKTPLVESGEIFDKETFVTVEKARILTENICNSQEGKGFNVKRPKLSRNKGRRRETFIPIKKEKVLT